ncbi:MAG: response regulator transcription factor [Chloroflexota bacterium]|nr:MAG: response regulator transcription factor [Chloroflexota bacterium]
MKNEHILVVDDEPQILRALRMSLSAHGYEVSTASDGEEALDVMAQKMPDIVILDLTMPRLDGLGLCRRIREWSQVPILVLSVRGSEKDKVLALDLGADDYLTKPFGIEELLARIRAALRRSTSFGKQEEAVFESGDLQIDLARRTVRLRGEEVRLTPTEYEVLRYLVTNSDKVITHRTLLQAVWGPQFGDEAQYLRVFIGQLRKKIEPDPTHPRRIVTEPGVGYRFRA